MFDTENASVRATATWEAAPEILGSLDLEHLTGTKASTWRYWAHIGTGPTSFKLGRRRVWKKSTVLAWLERQEAASACVQ